MNHLLLPKSVSYDNRKLYIRCYARDNYDNADFRSYPDRCGWVPRPCAEWHKTFQQASEEFQGFLQTWLYFGVVQLFFRLEMAMDTLTEPSVEGSGDLYLNSTCLVALVENWLGDLDTFQNSDYMALSDSLAEARLVHEKLQVASRSALATSSQVVAFADYLHLWPGGRDPRAPIMAEAQAALFDVIDGALAKARELQGGSNITGPLSSLAQTNGVSLYEGCRLWKLMRQDGWCPSELAMIFGSFSVAGIYFMSYVERPNQGHIHHLEVTESQHSNARTLVPNLACSNLRCNLYQLDQDSYKTRHTEDCEGCEDMYVEEDELLGILGRKLIPIVVAIGDNKKPKIVKLEPWSNKMPYVAISHVWADGLGNLRRNGIPRCQMLRLSAYAQDLMSPGESVYFWLDTLCCPPDSMNRPVEQGIALDLMRDTYAKAHTVLVIDKWLSTQTLCTDPTVDALFKVICSPWTRRLWTLQEGALAQKILIKCSDGIFDVDQAIRLLEQMEDIKLLNIKTDILHRWYAIRSFKDLDTTELFRALYPSLAFRTTSVFEDEPLCLATLFRLPVAPIAEKTTHEERMQEFWSAFIELPAEIMDHYEPRLQSPGFRWAPRSFMGNDETLFPYSHKMIQHGHFPPAIRTDKGLEVTAKGYYVHIKDLPLTGPIYVRHHAGFWAECSFSFDLDAIEPLNIDEISTDEEPSAVMKFSPKISHQAEEIGLIYHSWGHLENWKKAKRDVPSITGSVVSITAFQDDRISARRFGLFTLAPVLRVDSTVVTLENSLNEAIEAGYDVDDIVLVDKSTKSVLAGVLKQLPDDQAWLLD